MTNVELDHCIYCRQKPSDDNERIRFHSVGECIGGSVSMGIDTRPKDCLAKTLDGQHVCTDLAGHPGDHAELWLTGSVVKHVWFTWPRENVREAAI